MPKHDRNQNHRNEHGDVASVLAAERAARERIRQTREVAERSLEQALAEARRVEQRAVEATHAIRQSARARGARRIERLQASAEKHLAEIQGDVSAHDLDSVAGGLARACALELLGLPAEEAEG